MPNEYILTYIKQARANGFSDARIKELLQGAGWPAEEINEALNAGATPSSPPLSPTPASPAFFTPQSQSPLSGGLIKASQLLKESWRVFKQIFWKLIAIYIITFVSALPLLSTAWIFSSINILFFVILIALFAAIFAAAIIMSGLVFIFLVKERNRLAPSFWQNIKNGYLFAWHNFYSFLWLNALIGAIGLIGFFLLFVPGIIFIIWFAFPAYILVYENIKGIKALQYSRELVRGCWGKVFWRIIVMFLTILVIILPFALLSFINASFIKSNFVEELLGVIAPIVNMLVGLFAVIYAVLLYENLKNFKGAVNIESKKKTWYVVGAVAGLLVVPLLIGSVFFLIALSPKKLLTEARDSQRISNLSSLDSLIDLYLINAAEAEPLPEECDKYYWATIPGAKNYFSNSLKQAPQTSSMIDGTGWLPINFNLIPDGSPLLTLPIDPINNSDHFYAFSCNRNTTTFKLVADMESDSYSKNGVNDVEGKDGGDNPDIYEIGTGLMSKIGSNLPGETDMTYYQNLLAECESKNSPNCCIASVTQMASNNYKLEPANGCPADAQRNLLKCEDTFIWCESVQSSD